MAQPLSPARLASFFLLAAIATALAIFDLIIVVNHATAAGMHDFGAFDHAARQFLRGGDLYALEASLGRDGWLDLNPPHFHLLLIPAALLPRPVSLLAWWGLVAAAASISIRIVLRETKLTPSPHGWLALVAIACAWPGIVPTLWSSGIGYLLMLPFTLAWQQARRGNWRRAGVWLGLLLSAKLFLAVFLPFLVWKRRAAALMAAAAALCVTTLGVAVFGLDAYVSWLRALAEVDWQGWAFNASLQGMLTRLWADPATAISRHPALVMPASVALGIILVAASMVFLARRDRSGPAYADVAFGVLLVTAVLASPLGWIHYLVLAAGPVVAVILRHARAGIALDRPVFRRIVPVLGVLSAAGLLWPRPWLRPALSVYFWALAAGWAALLLAECAGVARDEAGNAVASAAGTEAVGA